MRYGGAAPIPNLTRGFRLPIPGVTGVPVRAYLAILVLFTVLIGPANYFILKRKNRQVLMVLTTPLISAAFLVLLAGYAVVGEGFGLRARANTLTFLDQGTKQAATHAVVSMYAAGMAPWGGLRFDRDTAIISSAGGGRSIGLDLTEAQHFNSGLIQARTPVNFDEVVVRAARERLTFSEDGEGFAVVNGLGGAVSALHYRSGGKIYTLAGPLADGARGVLRSADAPSDAALGGHAAAFKHFLVDAPADGAFFAVMDRSPFWVPGASTIDERGSRHVVTGYAGGQP
jgi:hypothetical protein